MGIIQLAMFGHIEAQKWEESSTVSTSVISVIKWHRTLLFGCFFLSLVIDLPQLHHMHIIVTNLHQESVSHQLCLLLLSSHLMHSYSVLLFVFIL